MRFPEAPRAAIPFVTTDANGAGAGGQEWDTLVGDDAIPGATIGTGYLSDRSPRPTLSVRRGLARASDGSFRPLTSCAVRAISHAGPKVAVLLAPWALTH